MDPVDNLAQSLLVGLVICSAMSDGYIMVKNIFHDKKTVENAEYCKDLLKVVTSYGLDKYKKTEDGKIIVEDEKTKPTIEIEKEVKKEKEPEKAQEPLTPWEQRGMTKEEYDQYKLKKKQKREREMEIDKQEQKTLKREKNKSFPMHK
jgi:hypothetical protein